MIPPIQLLLTFVPLGAVIWYACLHFDQKMRVLIEIPLLSCVGIVLFLRFGMHRDLKEEIRLRAPNRFKPVLGALMAAE
jgi:hypothetical protein